MKAIVNGQEIQCASGAVIRAGYVRLPLGTVPETISGEIPVVADDGFELCVVDPSQYLRSYMENGALICTNAPEPEKPDEEEVTLEDRMAALEADAAQAALDRAALTLLLTGEEI